MQFKLLASTLAVAATLTSAATLAAATDMPASQCNTGDLQCCNSTGTTKDASIATLLTLLGINVQDVTALVGVTCSPLTIIGAGGSSCTAQPVCCSNNTFNGVVALGCTPVNVNL